MSQHIDALPSRGDLTALSEQIAQREIRLDLGATTTSSTPEAVLQESFASMSEQTTYTGKIRTTSVSWLYTGYKYSTNYGVFHVWTYNTSNAPKVIRNYNGSWSSEQLATKGDIEVQTITPTFDTSLINRNGLFVRRTGNVVSVNGYCTLENAIPTDVAAIIGSMPSGSRPGDYTRVTCGISNQAYNPPFYMGYFSVGIDGDISVRSASGNTTYKTFYVSLTYMAQY